MFSSTYFLARLDWPTITLAALDLLFVAAAHLALRRWVRRRMQEDGSSDHPSGTSGPRSRLPRALVALAPPIALLLWTHGVYFAARLVLPGLLFDALVDRVIGALDRAYRVGLLGGVCWLFVRVGQRIDAFLRSLTARTERGWDDLLLPLAGAAIRRGLPLLVLILGMPVLALPPSATQVVNNATSLLLIGLVSFILYQAVETSASFVLRQHRLDVSDNLQARAVHTQVTVLKKLAVAAIGVFTLASMLMVFDSVRQFGTSILASAGLAGIVVGFAAQRSIATLLAGFQIALTQPIRVDDVVIVENEWGRIEDITLTYVVVRIWDLRRLVVPITYFIEQPFQNWTRSSSSILAPAFVHVDYTMPMDALREELTRILRASPHWDGQVDVLQVTDAKTHTLEVRALASAADAGTAWNLRCEIREKLVAFVQQQHPACLPRIRTSFEDVPQRASDALSNTSADHA